MSANDYIIGNGDCRFTQEVKVGDWVSVSSVPGTFVPVTEILTDNILGIAQPIYGADGSLQTITIRRPAIQASDITGNPLVSVLGNPNGFAGTILIGQDIISQEVFGPYALGTGVNIMDSNGINFWSPTTVNSTLSVTGAFTPNSISTTTLTVTGSAFKVIGNNVTVAGTVTANALTASSFTVSGTSLTFPVNLGGAGVTGGVPYSAVGVHGLINATDLYTPANIPLWQHPNGATNQVFGVSPTFNSFSSTTGNLNTGRAQIGATLLSNGKVLATGGQSVAPASLATCEIYDPSTSTWAFTGSLSTARSFPVVVTLPTGRVLAVGGNTGAAPIASCELYDPVAATWSSTGSMSTARYQHTATLLLSGPSGKVLATGGTDNSNNYFTSCELYNPVTGVWTATGSMSTARAYHTATPLPNGKVLIVGGANSGTLNLTTCELYDPGTGTFTATGSLNTGRNSHSTVLLPNGRVLVIGGESNFSSGLASCELYDPYAGVWTVTGSMGQPRGIMVAAVLPNGQVAAIGGDNVGNLASSELYNTSTGTWSFTGSLGAARRYHSGVLLNSGAVLIIGGYNAYTSSQLFSSTVNEWKSLVGNPNYIGLTFTSGRIAITGPSTVGSCNSNYSLVQQDRYVVGSATSAPLYFTLPSSTNVGGELHTLKKTDSSSNAVVVGTSVGNSLDGVTANFLTSQYAKVTFVSDNQNNWWSI